MINSFRGQYRWLSNFHACNLPPFVHDGVAYPVKTTEHGYQAMKLLNVADSIAVLAAATPGSSKKLAYTFPLRPGWQEERLENMEALLRSKFSSLNPDLIELLLATGGQELVEGNDWSDRWWGVCNGVGENHLGKILICIRSELQGKNKG